MWEDPRVWAASAALLSLVFGAGGAWVGLRITVGHWTDALEKVENKAQKAHDRIDVEREKRQTSARRNARKEGELEGELKLLADRVKAIGENGHKTRNYLGGRMGRLEMVIFEGFKPTEVPRKEDE